MDKPSLAAIVRNTNNYRRGLLPLLQTKLLHSTRSWLRYLDLAYPTKPADWVDYTTALGAKLHEPGRMAQFLQTMRTTPADAEAQLPNVKRPVLIIMGTADPDFVDPQAEGRAIVAALPRGLGTLETISGAGHYPHAERPDQTATLIITFMAELSA